MSGGAGFLPSTLFSFRGFCVDVSLLRKCIECIFFTEISPCPTPWEKEESSSNMPSKGDMLVPRRVSISIYIYTCYILWYLNNLPLNGLSDSPKNTANFF